MTRSLKAKGEAERIADVNTNDKLSKHTFNITILEASIYATQNVFFFCQVL